MGRLIPSRQLRRPKGKAPAWGTDRGFSPHPSGKGSAHERRQAIQNVSGIKRLFAIGVNGRGQRKSPGPLDGNGRGFDAGSLVVDSLRSRRGYPYTGTLTKGSSLCVLLGIVLFLLPVRPTCSSFEIQHERLVARIVRALPLSAADRHAFGEAGEYLGL